jgi:hypothetical protein
MFVPALPSGHLKAHAAGLDQISDMLVEKPDLGPRRLQVRPQCRYLRACADAFGLCSSIR